MQKRFFLLFFFLGFISVIAQVFTLREIMITFYGNEIFLGFSLGTWLFWTALGSFLGKKFISQKAFLVNLVFLAFLAPTSLVLIRFIKTFFPPGVLIDFIKAVFLTFILLSPLAFSLGFFFTTAFSFGRTKGLPFLASRAYLIEILGFAVGGFFINFYLLGFPPLLIFLFLSFLVLSLLGFYMTVQEYLAIYCEDELNKNEDSAPRSAGMRFLLTRLCYSAFGGAAAHPRRRTAGYSPCSWCNKHSSLGMKPPTLVGGECYFRAPFKERILLIPLFLVLFLAFLKLPALEDKTEKFQFPNLVFSQNSIYGRIVVTQEGSQYNFFESGALTGISQKTEAEEYLVHPILLEHGRPQKVLMIGGGLSGALGEILKHEPEKVDYVELDPVLVEVTKQYLHPEGISSLEDERLNLIFTDARKFVNETKQKYDVVIINLPPPSTALINRLYTKEAYADVKRILEPGGILAVNLSLPTDYISKEAEKLATSINQTIASEFKNILVLPEYTLLFLASNDEVLTRDPTVLIKRMEVRELETDYISPSYLENRLTTDRIKMFEEIFKKEGQVNLDFHPIAYFYQTLFWQTIFSPKLSLLYKVFPFLIFVLLVLVVFPFGLRKHQILPSFILGLSGATVMIWEIILIFSFQARLGLIYQKIGLLLAAVLVGMSLGNYLAGRFLTFRKHLKIILLLIILFCLIAPSVLEKARSQLIFFFMAVFLGVLAGTVFPLVMKGCLKAKKQVGVFYAADLAGSFLGTLFASLYLVPLLGFKATAYFLLPPFFLVLFILPRKPGQ